MTKSKIPSKVLEELQRQFNHELGAAHSYLALSAWCEINNLKGFASYFSKQSGEEREHADKIIAHLIDRDVSPEFAALPAPKQELRSLLDVAKRAQTMEQENTKGVNAVYEAALAAKDYPAQVLMHWFISEQVEEEAWCAEMIERVENASCAGGLSSLDRHIERYLAGDKEGEG